MRRAELCRIGSSWSDRGWRRRRWRLWGSKSRVWTKSCIHWGTLCRIRSRRLRSLRRSVSSSSYFCRRSWDELRRDERGSDWRSWRRSNDRKMKLESWELLSQDHLLHLRRRSHLSHRNRLSLQSLPSHQNPQRNQNIQRNHPRNLLLNEKMLRFKMLKVLRNMKRYSKIFTMILTH